MVLQILEFFLPIYCICHFSQTTPSKVIQSIEIQIRICVHQTWFILKIFIKFEGHPLIIILKNKVLNHKIIAPVISIFIHSNPLFLFTILKLFQPSKYDVSSCWCKLTVRFPWLIVRVVLGSLHFFL